MNSTVKTVVFWVVIGLSALLLWTVIQQGRGGQKDKEVNFSQFMTSGACQENHSAATLGPRRELLTIPS